MSTDHTDHTDHLPADAASEIAPYAPPTVRPLGSLADLTLGGVTSGVPDAYGFSGDDDSFGSNM